MDSDNYEVIYCPGDDEYRVYCNICDKLCIERYYRIISNHKPILITNIKENHFK